VWSLGNSKKTRFDIAGVALILLCFLFCVIGLSRFQSNTEDVVQWLPDNSPSRLLYDRFKEKFGSDDFLVITWKDCTVADPRLKHLCQRIVDQDSDKLIQSVVNGTDLITRLKNDAGLSKKSVLNRFRGIFFGTDDPNQTLALIALTKNGTANRRESLRQIEVAIENTPDLDRQEITFGGYPYVGLNIDNQLKNSILYFLLPSVICASVMSLLCLRNIILSSIVFFAAFGSTVCSIAIVPLLGVKFGGLMSIIPALVYILTTSGSIHLVHYSLDVIGDPKKLLAIGWRPCCISALTTAIGMLALGRSSFPAIRSFGFFCATGAGFALVFQLVIVPWLLHRLGESGQRTLAARATDHSFWNRTSSQIYRFRFAFALAGIALMVFAAVGLSRLTARVEVEKLFSPKSEIIASLTKLEQRMGPIDQVELLVEFEDVGAEDFHVRSQLIYKLQRYLSSVEEIETIHSLQNYLPRQPSIKRVGSFFQKRIYQQKLDEQRDTLAKSRYLNVGPDSETWRISLRFPFTEETNFGELQSQVTDTAAEAIETLFLKDEFAVLSSPVRLSYTGKTHLFHSAQLTLLADFYRNFLLAFAIITPVLIIVLRSFWLGLVAMIPNLFPIVVFFGALGWFNFPVDLAIAMTACVALGIAVDDTTHFLIRYREFGGTGSNVLPPIQKAISQCGAAMSHTTAIGSAGLLVYGISEMVVVKNFSLAITGMLVLALIADIFVLPALLLLHTKSEKSEPMT
jgi:predicted RND superfamily exporter protein